MIIVAKTFFDAVNDLSKPEQAIAFRFLAELLANQISSGLSLERIKNTRSKGLWSARITRDLRAILHKEGNSSALLYADHHDAAYRWAERRDVGRHPVTGEMQITEVIETVEEVVTRVEKVRGLFEAHEDDYLVSLGLPLSWIPVIRKVRTEDEFLGIASKLPDEVSDRLLRVCTGELVTPPVSVADRPLTQSVDPRRFYVATDQQLLRAAIDAPFDRWITFLHPTQKKIVEANFSGPAKVSGSAGTGKTVVAMHRARSLARQGKRVLLTTYVKSLCANIEWNLRLFCSEEELSQITVSTVHSQALGLARKLSQRLKPADEKRVEGLLAERTPEDGRFTADFVASEWRHVIVAQGITTWADYRRAKRYGRGKGLTVRDRRALWEVFEDVRDQLDASHQADWAAICARATACIEQNPSVRFDAVIVDEVQDLSVPELRVLSHLCAEPGNLMLCGDTGQRIYAGGFSLSRLGIEVRGRSTVLRINYRTTEQIRRAADRLLGDTCGDMDGGTEARKTRSLLHGPEPSFAGYPGPGEENSGIAQRVQAWIEGGIKPDAIAVFARTNRQVKAIGKALQTAGVSADTLQAEGPRGDGVNVGTMHRAKGLEFKVVIVAAVTDKLLPYHLVIGRQSDPQDREQAIDNERRLLYVALTRAREEVHVTWHRQPSRFLADCRPDVGS